MWLQGASSCKVMQSPNSRSSQPPTGSRTVLVRSGLRSGNDSGRRFLNICVQGLAFFFSLKFSYLSCSNSKQGTTIAGERLSTCQARKKSTKINFLGPETAGWGRGLPCEGVVVEKFESLSSLGLEGRNLGCPGTFAGISRTLGGVQKVCAK